MNSRIRQPNLESTAMIQHKTRYTTQLAIAMFVCLTTSLTVQAAELEVQVNNTAGRNVEDAVVYLLPQSKSPVAAASMTSIAQKNKTFMPHVTVIQTGSSISFPNKDSVRHHVYSFSPAKTFELKLYANVPTAPVVFDKAGTVVLGCNIHDQMLAFIHIVDTPYFAKTDASGKVKLTNLPSGQYQLKVWHPALKKENVALEQPVTIKAIEAVSISLDIKAEI
jgi:plastocyanin